MDRTGRGIFVDADLRSEEPADVVHIGCVAGGGNDGSSDAQIELDEGSEIRLQVFDLSGVVEDYECIANRAKG